MRKKIVASIGLAAAATLLTGAAYASASSHDLELHESFGQARTPMVSARIMGASPTPFTATREDDGTIRITAYAVSTKAQRHMLVPEAIQTGFISTARVMSKDYPAAFIKAMQDGAWMRYEGITRCGADAIEWNTAETAIDIGGPATATAPLYPALKTALEDRRPTPAAMELICEEATRS